MKKQVDSFKAKTIGQSLGYIIMALSVLEPTVKSKLQVEYGVRTNMELAIMIYEDARG